MSRCPLDEMGSVELYGNSFANNHHLWINLLQESPAVWLLKARRFFFKVCSYKLPKSSMVCDSRSSYTTGVAWSRLESLQDHSRPPGTESALIGISFETALDWLRNQTKKTCVSNTYHIYIYIYIYTYIHRYCRTSQRHTSKPSLTRRINSCNCNQKSLAHITCASRVLAKQRILFGTSDSAFWGCYHVWDSTGLYGGSIYWTSRGRTVKTMQRNLKCGECITQEHQPVLKGWSCIFVAQESEKEEVGVFAAPNISSWATDKRQIESLYIDPTTWPYDFVQRGKSPYLLCVFRRQVLNAKGPAGSFMNLRCGVSWDGDAPEPCWRWMVKPGPSHRRKKRKEKRRLATGARITR